MPPVACPKTSMLIRSNCLPGCTLGVRHERSSRPSLPLLMQTSSRGQRTPVWLNQNEWNRGGDLRLDIRMADLSPRGRYRDRIKRCDLLADLPQDDAGYIIMDPPVLRGGDRTVLDERERHLEHGAGRLERRHGGRGRPVPRLRLAGRGEKIHEMVCRCGGRVPIREVCRARSTTATIRTDLGVSGTLGTCGASNASNETRRS